MPLATSVIFKETHTALALETPQRLSDYAAGIFQSVPSRKGMKKAIRKGLVVVDGQKGTTGLWIRGGETIELYAPDESARPVYQLELKVAYCDAHLAVVVKPPGIETSGNKFRTLENALPHNIPVSTEPGALARPVTVHRLDFPTSGLVLVARTKPAQIALSRMFEQDAIKKTYHAAAIGDMPPEGEITLPVDGKPAHTDFRVLRKVESKKYGFLCLVLLTPTTGRTHQLRIHLHAIGHPILGDRQYAREDLLPSSKGLYLHASSLEFRHPVTDESIVVEERFPGKFIKVFGVSI